MSSILEFEDRGTLTMWTLKNIVPVLFFVSIIPDRFFWSFDNEIEALVTSENNLAALQIREIQNLIFNNTTAIALEAEEIEVAYTRMGNHQNTIESQLEIFMADYNENFVQISAQMDVNNLDRDRKQIERSIDGIEREIGMLNSRAETVPEIYYSTRLEYQQRISEIDSEIEIHREVLE